MAAKAEIDSAMIITVIIPTYRRSEDLRRCLDALSIQVRLPDEVLVIVRESDEETNTFIQNFDRKQLPLRLVRVSISGQVAALNAGLEEACGGIIAILDDDTAPFREWLKHMEAHFAADTQVGGVGGRDWQPIERGNRKVVGKVQWFGRVIGNHHLGAGPPREVDILKGANMGWRSDAIQGIRFDKRLRGSGVQQHNDMGFSLAVKNAGWKLIYDPEVAIDHFPAPRIGEGQHHRGLFNADEQRNSVFNETLNLLTYLPPLRRLFFLIWAFLIGTRAEPGPLQVPRLLARREQNVWQRLLATYSGRLSAVKFTCGRRKV